ncbi:MAG: periplasmic heavy metal sensor [Candidatus Omnitrophica bacterium]|nr:periplasmic heavy metal sensor [Candidatus Omnitrophota bacterium]
MRILTKQMGVYIGVFLFLALPLAQGQNAPEGPGYSKGYYARHGEDVYNHLNLTTEQRHQLFANKLKHDATFSDIHRRMKADRQELQAQLMKADLNMKKVNELKDQIKALQSEMEDARISSILAVRSILTPSQFADFLAMIGQHHHGHEK